MRGERNVRSSEWNGVRGTPEPPVNRPLVVRIETHTYVLDNAVRSERRPLTRSTPSYGSTFQFFTNANAGHWEQIDEFGYGNNGFPIRFHNAPGNLPLLQDLYQRQGSGSSALWNINHSQNSSIRANGGSTNQSKVYNVAAEYDGLGATILFYDGSARFIKRDELERTDIYPDNPTNTYAMKSLLPE